MIAQVDVGSVPSWMSVFLQGGAFALICYIIIILYPRMSKEARIERDARDQRFERVVELLNVKFEERNTRIIVALKDQTTTLKEAVLSIKPKDPR